MLVIDSESGCPGLEYLFPGVFKDFPDGIENQPSRMARQRILDCLRLQEYIHAGYLSQGILNGVLAICQPLAEAGNRNAFFHGSFRI